jgi:hypothetical protein
MEVFIVFGIVAVPLFLLGLFAVYKGRKSGLPEVFVPGHREGKGKTSP